MDAPQTPDDAVATPPLVSVIIPCYNHGAYLQQAIDSVKTQTYAPVEIIVIDDGSVDNTPVVAARNPDVRYVYQPNQGLSAARNTGIDHSRGALLVFLDADDLLYPDAIACNVDILTGHPDAAFVSGGHHGVDQHLNVLWTTQRRVTSDHYRHFLRGNYVGMHATVLYRRHVFNGVRFDTSLRACEDYDLYLTLSARYPVLHHTQVIAAYRQHQTNMSSDALLMLTVATAVLQRHRNALTGADDRAAYRQGVRFWHSLYCRQMYGQLVGTPSAMRLAGRESYTKFLRTHRPLLYLRYRLTKYMPLKSIAKRMIPSIALRWLHRAGLFPNYLPRVGSVRAGDLQRLTPLSTSFGYERGGPVDRYYIETFLQQQAGSIRGRVLEIGSNDYTLQFGGRGVTTSDVLHVTENSPGATVIGDLTALPQVASDTFDCIVLTQTLHLIYDFHGALQTCFRILKPGGTLLLTSPGISPVDHGEWQQSWYWSFTELSVRRMLGACFPDDHVVTQTHGNVFVATAFLYGLGRQEVTQPQLDSHDPHYPVIITAKAQKPQ